MNRYSCKNRLQGTNDLSLETSNVNNEHMFERLSLNNAETKSKLDKMFLKHMQLCDLAMKQPVIFKNI